MSLQSRLATLIAAIGADVKTLTTLANGKTAILSGSGVPSAALGVLGDWYYRTANKTFYRNVGGGWQLVGMMKDSGEVPYCRVRSQVNNSWGSTTIPQVTFPFLFPTTAIQGDDSMWDPATGKITLNKSGRWLIGFELAFNQTAAVSGHRDCILAANAAVTRYVEDRVISTAGQVAWLKGSDISEFSSGDYLRLFPSQNSGANLDIIQVAATASKMYAYFLDDTNMIIA